MACKEITADTPRELLKAVVSFVTDPSQFTDALNWDLVSLGSVDELDYKVDANGNKECADSVVIRGKGEGDDEIYVGFNLKELDDGSTELELNGFAGYDAGLEWAEQPGNIYHDTYPIIPLPNINRFKAWVSANTSRIILVVQLSSQYEPAYLGLMKPTSVQRQYPYPMMIGGSCVSGIKWDNTSAEHSCFISPSGINKNKTSLRLRRSDGVWECGYNTETNQLNGRLVVWPQCVSPTQVLTVLDDALSIENVIMFPELLYECGELWENDETSISDPTGIIGQMDGVYFIGNREDTSAKDVIMHDGHSYMVFANIRGRANDSYFCIEWD